MNDWKFFYVADFSDNERPSDEENLVADLAFKRRMDVEGYSSIRDRQFVSSLERGASYKFRHVFYAQLK